jgi:hypothetical protein
MRTDEDVSANLLSSLVIMKTLGIQRKEVKMIKIGFIRVVIIKFEV